MKYKEKNVTFAAARLKAKKYFDEKKVHILSEDHGDGTRTVKGKVVCDFGFVHHPAVMVKENGTAGTVAASACDCYESNENDQICSHCQALIYEAYGEENLPVRKDRSLCLYQEEESSRTYPFALTIKSQSVNANGLTEVSGRAKCAFGFIHYPNILIEDHEMTAYSCDCYLAAESLEPCEHCKALFQKVSAAVSGSKSEEKAEREMLCEEAELKISFEEAGPESPCEEEEFPVREHAPENPEEDPKLPDFRGEAAEADSEADSEAEGFSEEMVFQQHEPTTMRILLGTEETTGEEVYWCPNDTGRLFHTNTGIIGTMGTGKTQFTKSLITQLYEKQCDNFTGRGLGILIFDYKGDYNESKPDFVQAVNARILKPYKLPFNPFSLDGYSFKPRLPLHIASTFTDIVTKIFRLGPKQSTVLLHSIIQAYKKCGIEPGVPETWNKKAPTFKEVYDAYLELVDNANMDSLYAAMTRLFQFEIFEEEESKTVSLYKMLHGVCVVDLSGYDPSIQNLIVAIMLELFYSQMQNAGSSPVSGKYRCLTKFILVDEADNFMSQNFQAIKKILKEGREFGVGVILSTQFLHHFKSRDEDYSKYILTWVVHNVADLKNSDIEFVFNAEKNSAFCEALFHKIKSLECHRSILKIANEDPMNLKDKPFFELMNERKS